MELCDLTYTLYSIRELPMINIFDAVIESGQNIEHRLTDYSSDLGWGKEEYEARGVNRHDCNSWINSVEKIKKLLL